MRPLLVLAIAISTVSGLTLSALAISTANAHTGRIDNVCTEDSSGPGTVTVVCSVKPEVGQVVTYFFGTGSEPWHRTVAAVDETINQVTFCCAHDRDGNTAEFFVNTYTYQVRGNR